MEDLGINIDPNYLACRGFGDYYDGDIILMNNFQGDMTRTDVVKLNMVLMVYCREGRMQGDINDKTYTVGAGDLIVCLPNTYLANTMRSVDFEATMIGLSYPGIKMQVHGRKDIWDILAYLKDNPVLHLSDIKNEMFSHYTKFIEMKMSTPDEHFHTEQMQALFQMLFWEMASLVEPLADKSYEGSMRQCDLLFKRFIMMVAESQGRERSVRYFASRMCITPKYLSSVVKSVSGKTALEWIHQYAAEAIAVRLKYSEHSIKEISNDLKFPNLSFFGKFVKTHLGASPSEFRKSQAEKKQQAQEE